LLVAVLAIFAYNAFMVRIRQSLRGAARVGDEFLLQVGLSPAREGSVSRVAQSR